MIDLRSDTVTRPTPAMRSAIAAATVGDDVLGDDPTVDLLEQRVADLLGKEAALFVPSGTMSNQLGVSVHCRAGDELVCDTQCHIYNYEQAAHSQLFGIATRPIDSHRGIPSQEQLRTAIRPDDQHFPRTRLLCLENSHNRWGGRVADFEEAQELCELASDLGIGRHLDGARLWNAAVASDEPWQESLLRWAGLFDTVSVCFSKGLGAPIGSALVGPAELIKAAHRTRKALGGGWRQAGVLAPAVLHALDHHVDRLAEDHRHATQLADVIRSTDGLTLVDNRCDTNLILFDVDPSVGTAAQLGGALLEQGIHVLGIGPQRVRAVTHLDIDDAAMAAACTAIESAVATAGSTRQSVTTY